MNDRYFFKAKRLDNGEWVQGNLLSSLKRLNGISEKVWLIHNPYDDEKDVVDPSTICQCTGLKDKNGTLIWENDICIYDDMAKFVVKFGEYNEFTDERHVGFCTKWENSWDGLYREDLGYWSDLVEVIGSCFDNPELLEVE